MPAPTADWTPSDETVARARITRFAEAATRATGRDLSDYHALWAWSVAEPAAFWALAWDELGMPPRTPGAVLETTGLPHARWFPDARLNYTTEVFRDRDPAQTAVVAVDENGVVEEIGWGELERRVASLAAVLAEAGVGTGDRVVGYLPHRAEAVVAFLATASLGAVWAGCGLDYAGSAALARFGQLEPTALVTATRATLAGRPIDRGDDVALLRAGLPSLRLTVAVGPVGTAEGEAAGDVLPWAAAVARQVPLEPVTVPFDHPLWVLFSSGTTGVPKGIVHGHGGVVLEHRKHAALHLDLGPDDRMLWYTSPSWMMWNFLVGGLLVGASIVCYDGSPAHPAPDRLWQLAADLGVTCLGTSPGYLAACRKAGVELADHDLSALRSVGVTGSTLPADLHRWAQQGLPEQVPVISSSGGTDVVTAFVAGAPTLPVWAGELSAPCLGVAVASYDDRGRPVRGEVGELVVTAPLPSMPLCFWDDPDGERLRAAYFDTFPGVWRHGDWVTLTDHGSVVIHGRSDATLNRRGVRMGSADIYGPVEALAQVTEALVVGLEEDDGGYWMPLFVTTAAGVVLDDDLRDTIRHAIRAHASPRHVPDEILAAPGIPHTRTGKKLEVPVKRVLRGDDPRTVVDPASTDDPGLLDWYAQVGADHRSPVPSPTAPTTARSPR